MKHVHVEAQLFWPVEVKDVFVLYGGRIYKATVTKQGYLVGELNIILPFYENRVISLAA
jgi:hypothetical protein